MDRVDVCSNHVSYHVESARVSLSQLMRVRVPEFTGLVASLHDLQLCVLDAQAVSTEIIEYAIQEERLLGANSATWRAAAKSLYEIATRGPCLQGDEDFPTRVVAVQYRIETKRPPK